MSSDHGHSHDHGHDHGHGHAADQQPRVQGDTAQAWDERYADEQQVWSGEPNGSLVTELRGVTPGRALDVGCGEGADAVWLAGQGWQVTALELSGVALDRARLHAEQAGVEAQWVHAGLLDAELPPGGFDLVSVQYPALRRTPDADAEHALLRCVAPGGVLLVVHHEQRDLEHAKEQGFDPRDYVMPQDVAAVLDDGWQVDVHETRARQISGGSGAHHHNDIVLRARRLG